jgi:hypothetical protein
LPMGIKKPSSQRLKGLLLAPAVGIEPTTN